MSAAAPLRYRIEPFSNSVRRNLRRIHPVPQRRIQAAIDALADNPRPDGAIQLAPGLYRIRIGDYRVIYRVNDPERWVEIGRVEHCGERTYRGLAQL